MVVKSWLKKVYICDNPFHGVMPIFQFMLSTKTVNYHYAIVAVNLDTGVVTIIMWFTIIA